LSFKSDFIMIACRDRDKEFLDVVVS